MKILKTKMNEFNIQIVPHNVHYMYGIVLIKINPPSVWGHADLLINDLAATLATVLSKGIQFPFNGFPIVN